MRSEFQLAKIRKLLSQVLPASLVQLVRSRRDQYACASFLLDPRIGLSVGEKIHLINQLYVISSHILSYHTQAEALAYVRAILELPTSSPGVIVEAGCYKGGSTAKLSLAAAISGIDGRARLSRAAAEGEALSASSARSASAVAPRTRSSRISRTISSAFMEAGKVTGSRPGRKTGPPGVS